MKKHFLLLAVSFILLSCNADNTPQIKPSSSSLVNEAIQTNPKPQESNTPIPAPSQDENILSPLPPILAFGQTDDYYYTLDDLVEYSEQEKKEKFESSHIFYINENVLKEGITKKEAILNKDIVDVTEGSYPEYSPDNKLISFLHNENKEYTFFKGNLYLYVMKAGDLTGKTKILISKLPVSKYDWINNDEILIQSNKELHIINVNTKKEKLISNSLYSLYDLSPNKKKLAFSEVNIYLSLCTYDLENESKDILIKDESFNYISNASPYDFYSSIKWNSNNEDIVFLSDNATKIVKISTKNKELLDLFNIKHDLSEESFINEIFYYSDNNIMFLSNLGGSSDIDGHGIILSLNYFSKKLSILNITGGKVIISKEKRPNEFFYFDISPYGLLRLIDTKRSDFVFPFRKIFLYSFIH